MKFLQRIDHRCGIVHQRLPRHESGQNHNYADIENRAHNQGGDDADGNVALRILAFLGGRGNGIEADVSEKNDRAAGENSRPPVGRERMPVGGVNETRCEGDEDKDGNNFQQDHYIVGFRGLADSANEDYRQQHDDDERGPVEAQMPARRIQHVPLQIGEPARKIGGSNPAQARVDAEPIQQTNNVRGEPYANGHVADRVLENEVPAYDPGDEFTHRSVRVGVRAAGNRNHGGQFGVANRCESAHDRHQDEGQRDGWSGSGTSEGSRMVNQIFEQGRVKNGFYLEFLAGDRCANDGENSRPNHGADSKRSEAEPAQRLLQSNFGVFGIRHQLVDALAAEEG